MNKNLKKIVTLFWVTVVSLSMCAACGGTDDVLKEDDDHTSGSIDEEVEEEIETNPNEEIDDEGAVKIVFDAQSATVTNPYEGKGVSIAREGADVVVKSTLSDEISYILSGSTMEGSLKMYSDTKFELKMNGVSIVNSDDPALNIQSGKKVTVTLIDGTSNRLAGGTSFASEGGDEDIKAAFFSEGQLVFGGAGNLEVISRYRHAICSDDYIRIDGGNITIPMAAKDGIHTKDYLEINGGTISLNSIGDGLESESAVTLSGGTITITTTGESGHGVKSATELLMTSGNLTIDVQGVGSKAIKSDGDLTIHDGVIVIKTSAQEAEGIESKTNLTINGGDLTIEAYDDCINASNSIVVNGGSIYCYSITNDGFDSNGTLTITGGTIVSVGSTSPEEGFDCDRNTFKITGGTLIGIGGATSTPTTNACTQYSLVYSGRDIPQHSYFNITSSDGKNILTYVIPKSLNNITVLYSSPGLTKGTSYTISKGGSVTGGTDFHGLYSNATYSGGTSLATFTVSSMVTTVGSSGNNPGGPGGRP